MKIKYRIDLRKLSFDDEHLEQECGGPCSISYQELGPQTESHALPQILIQHGSGAEITSQMAKLFGDDCAAQMYNHGAGAVVEVVLEATYIWNPVDWRLLVDRVNGLLSRVADEPRIELRTFDERSAVLSYCDGVIEDKRIVEVSHSGEYINSGWPVLHFKETTQQPMTVNIDGVDTTEFRPRTDYETVLGKDRDVAAYFHGWF